MMSEHETEAASEDTGAAEETPSVAESAAVERVEDRAQKEPAAGERVEDRAQQEPAAGERVEDRAQPEPAPAADDADPAAAIRRQHGRPRLKLEDLQPGQQFQGKIVGLAKFGAFVDIGAVTDGLVHLTEFSGKRVRRAEDAVALGDEVDVWIKEVDHAGSRISLSMRKKPRHPIKGLSAGDVLTGVVTSTTEYGVFVDVGSETEGLVHISEISSGYVQKPSDVVKPGDAVEVRVKEVDLGRERISLSMVGLANDLGLDAPAPEAKAAAEASGDVSAAAEPEERRPTVVELALRRMMGEAEEEDEESLDEGTVEEASDHESLGEIYERMLTEYRASKDEG